MTLAEIQKLIKEMKAEVDDFLGEPVTIRIWLTQR